MRKRILAIFTALVLALGLFPTVAFATGEHWAQQAVDALNGIYGNNVFTGDDTTMTEGDAYSILQSMGSVSSEVTDNSETLLTRAKACTILTEIFHIPVGNTSDIQYLYEQNIINGKSESDLDENGTVTKAQFAVLTYRALNFVGGGKGSSVTSLKPGTKEYFSWMYLAARKVVDFNIDAVSGDITNDIWSEWITQLTRDEIPSEAKPTGPFNPACPEISTTKLAAAVQMVDAYIGAGGSPTIFSDVKPDDWWYDGVMYLFDQQIVQGQGDGTFGLQTLPRFQLAVLLAVLDGADCANETGMARITGSVNYAIEKGYMTGTKFEEESSWGADNEEWGNSVYSCREDTVVAILKQQEVNVSGVNTAILDRFSDSNDISEEAEPYMAYAVSHGLISGTTTSTLSPDGDVNRPQIGVLAYRILISLDTTKMQDYRENISFVLPTESSGQ